MSEDKNLLFAHKKAYYLCRLQIHDGNATYIRIENNAKLIKTRFKDCEIVDFGLPYKKKKRKVKGKYVEMMRIAWTQFANKHRVRKFIKTHDDIGAIFCNFMMIGTMKYLKKYCHKHHIPLICDYSEWNEKEEKKNGRLSLGLKRNHYSYGRWMDRSLNAIGISSYICQHFIKQGINTLHLPNTLQVDNYNYVPSQANDYLSLVFVGNRGRIDYVNHLISGLNLLSNEERAKIRVLIVGSDLSENGKSPVDPRELANVKDCLEYHFRLPYEELVKKYYRADFSIFIYSSTLRYAKAVFPTKLSDAFIHSRPVIGNIVEGSDMKNYLRDFENAILMKSEDPHDVKDALKKALALSKAQKEAMCQTAFLDGKKFFDQRNYHAVFNTFIDHLVM